MEWDNEEITVPGGNTLEWYNHDIGFSMALMESFVKGVEKQILESINKYKSREPDYIVEEYSGSDHESVTEWHQGLDDGTYDLNGIFQEYFPNLQRRSALLTVYGYFEHELDNLCGLFQKEKSYKISLSDLKGKGVDRSTLYLEKVVGIDTCKTSSAWSHIKNIQKIRNIIVHQDGKIDGSDKQAVLEYISTMGCLSGATEVVLVEGFLSFVVKAVDDYFKLLNKSIHLKHKHSIN